MDNELHLNPASSEDAGSYSCAVKGHNHLSSTAVFLSVRCKYITALSTIMWYNGNVPMRILLSVVLFSLPVNLLDCLCLFVWLVGWLLCLFSSSHHRVCADQLPMTVTFLSIAAGTSEPVLKTPSRWMEPSVTMATATATMACARVPMGTAKDFGVQVAYSLLSILWVSVFGGLMNGITDDHSVSLSGFPSVIRSPLLAHQELRGVFQVG